MIYQIPLTDSRKSSGDYIYQAKPGRVKGWILIHVYRRRDSQRISPYSICLN